MSSQAEITIFNKSFITVTLINFFVKIGYYLLFVISSRYAAQYFDAPPSLSGLAAGIMLIGCMCGRLVTGHMVSVIGFRKILISGLCIYMASIALYFVAHNMLLFILIRFVGGVGVGCMGTVTGTVVAYCVPSRHQGLGVSYFSMSTILALAFGPFLGIFLLQRTSFPALFLLCLVLGGISLVLAVLVTLKEVSRSPSETNASSSLLNVHNYIDRDVLPFALVVMFVCFCWGNIQAFMSFFAEETGLSTAASVFFLIYAIIVFTTRPLSGRLLDRRGEHVVVYPALLLLACGLAMLGAANSTWVMLLSGAVIGVGFGNFQSTGQAISLKLVSRHRYGQATSTFFVLLDCGIGLGPYLSGFIVPLAGYRGVYIASALVALLAIPLYYLVHGRKALPRRSETPVH